MTPAEWSLIALLVVIGASLTSRLNVGVLAVALAWPIAVFGAGWKVDQVMTTFPSSLFLMLVGVTLLFGVAQVNGTMDAITHAGVRALRGRSGWLPVLLFVLACTISTMGPGAIATVALLAPIGMGLAHEAEVPPLLTALMIGNGANAGNLSPIGAIGILVHGLMEKAGLGGHPWAVWGANFAAHCLAALIAWLLFGGPKLISSHRHTHDPRVVPFTRTHSTTVAVGALWMLGVVVFKLNPGLAAFGAAALLVLAGLGDDSAMIKQVPWSVLIMVCGVSVLVGVLEKTGGMDLFTTLLSKIATPNTVNGAIAGVTGLLSTYSSTSGVVYPAFLPAVPGLVAKLGGGDPLQVALSINVGAAVVDVSPLSTLGSLCIAAVPAGTDTKRLFRQLLLWGFSMTVLGAVFCQFLIRFFAAG